MEEHKNHITCSLVRTTRGISPSILAMFTLAPFCIKSFTIYSISRPLAVCNAVLPANVFLFTSAPRDIKNSAMICFPASTAWWSGVRPLLESWKHRMAGKKSLDAINSSSVWLFLCFCFFFFCLNWKTSSSRYERFSFLRDHGAVSVGKRNTKIWYQKIDVSYISGGLPGGEGAPYSLLLLQNCPIFPCSHSFSLVVPLKKDDVDVDVCYQTFEFFPKAYPKCFFSLSKLSTYLHIWGLSLNKVVFERYLSFTDLFINIGSHIKDRGY